MKFIDYITEHMKLDPEDVQHHRENWEAEFEEQFELDQKRYNAKKYLEQAKMAEAIDYVPTQAEIDDYLKKLEG